MYVLFALVVHCVCLVKCAGISWTIILKIVFTYKQDYGHYLNHHCFDLFMSFHVLPYIDLLITDEGLRMS